MLDDQTKIDDLEIVKQVFDKFNVKFFVVYGTCLGFHRDGNFIQHDDDIDLAVVEPINLETRKAIGWLLYDLGFKTQEIMFNVFKRMEVAEQGYNGDEESGIIICERYAKFTIFFFKKEMCDIHGEEYVCIPKLGALRLISSPAKFYEKSDTIKINNKEYNVPHPVEDYLEYSYIDWKDKLGRDHSPTYNQAHSQGILRNVLKNNEATKIL
jgi:hypothetical protein